MMEGSPQQQYKSLMEAMQAIMPTIANHSDYSREDIITAIAKVLRLQGMTMEVLRDTCVGAFMKDLCEHQASQIRSAALIALDCFETTLFDWADSVGWSTEPITKACLEADKEIRRRALRAARHNGSGRAYEQSSNPAESSGSRKRVGLIDLTASSVEVSPPYTVDAARVSGSGRAYVQPSKPAESRNGRKRVDSFELTARRVEASPAYKRGNAAGNIAYHVHSDILNAAARSGGTCDGGGGIGSGSRLYTQPWSPVEMNYNMENADPWWLGVGPYFESAAQDFLHYLHSDVSGEEHPPLSLWSCV